MKFRLFPKDRKHPLVRLPPKQAVCWNEIVYALIRDLSSLKRLIF